jgi:hypothetical protein
MQATFISCRLLPSGNRKADDDPIYATQIGGILIPST